MEQIPYTEQKKLNLQAEAPALDRGLAILEVLDKTAKGMTLTEISKSIGSPKNSTSRLIQTLIAKDYVVRDDTTNSFKLTGKLLQLGQARVGEVSLVECSLDAMRELRDVVGETVQLGIPIGDEGIIIEKIESRRAVRIGVDIGIRFPLYNNAPGKVLLAHQQPARERGNTIQRLKLKRCTARTITGKKALREECDLVIKKGYSCDWGEADIGINCVAAPVKDRHEKLVAAIWVSGIAGLMPKKRFPSIGKNVMEAASKIERKLRL